MKGGGRRGEERGSSGSSRGIPNLVSPIPNASSDPYAAEFNYIVEGNTDPQLPYHKLSKKITYKRVFYNHDTKQYSVNKPKTSSPTVEKPSVPPAEGHIAPTPATEGSVDANQSQNGKIFGIFKVL